MNNRGFSIQTHSGNMFNPKTGHIESIDINDIAHALSNICRYTGHCKKFYSVAEHSVLVYKIVKKLWPSDLEAHWAALLHDASEAYIGDIATPLKVLLPSYAAIEKKLTKKVEKSLNVKNTKAIHERVKTADMIALSTEARILFESVEHWDAIKKYDPMTNMLTKNFPLPPAEAKKLFQKEYKKLVKSRAAQVKKLVKSEVRVLKPVEKEIGSNK